MQPLHNNCFEDHASVVLADFSVVSMFFRQDVFYTPKPQHSIKGGSITHCHVASAWASSACCPSLLFTKIGTETWSLLLNPPYISSKQYMFLAILKLCMCLSKRDYSFLLLLFSVVWLPLFYCSLSSSDMGYWYFSGICKKLK